MFRYSFRFVSKMLNQRICLRVLTLVFCFSVQNLITFAQDTYEVIDLKDPITGKWGYASKIQNRKSPVKGIKKIAASSFSNVGSALMSKEDALNIDWVIPPLYDAVASEFSEDLAGVEIGGLVGFIDINNRFIIEPRFEPVDNLTGFKLGLAAVKIGVKYGFINKKGEVVISPVYDYAENFKENMLATIKQNGKFGAIDLKGDIVVPCKYVAEAAMVTVPISNKPYKSACDSIKKAFDNQAYSSIYTPIKECADEVQLRISDSLWIQPLVTTPLGEDSYKGIKDNYNRMIIPCQFSSIEYDEQNHLYIVKNASNRIGIYSYKGDRFFHPLFDEIGPFEGGISEVSVGGVTGIIDSDGWIDPSFMDDICNAGLEYDGEGNTSKARKMYERILDIDPNHVMALNNLAIIDINNEDYNKGMKKLKLAHKLAPDNALIDENLHMAKKNRNERRWNRINTGLEIALAVVTIGAVTYAAVNGQSLSSSGSGMTPSESLSSTGTADSYSSSGVNSKSSTSTKKVSYANWKSLDVSYGDYEEQLIKMKTYGNYNVDEVRRIQKEMKELRGKIYKQSGGHVRAVSPMETWNP